VELPAKHVSVSRTSGDFAVVSQPVDVDENFSTLSLFTINGNLVSSRRCEPPIDAVTFSTSPEGVAVNVVATGHRTTGVIRLWNSWDLTPVRDIDTKVPQFSIVALAFSFDNQNLFAATSAGDVIIFEKSDVTGMQRPPKYLNLTEM
jgi:lysosomal-trafficking regulator